ncbi:ATP-binding protein [Candidatus Endomicrobiellum agilis]|uniref:ATP-binding protein n=1 Tax=Candidatus Endomicrobiellum agilis TaxID=3238957 RepID=UPI00357A056B|nr:ATP-binding protein [Endomicrobium sp.]
MNNPFDHNCFLGYVNEITPQYVKVHFPSSGLLSKFHHNGVNFAGGNVGNFIIIEGEEYGFLARIVKLNLPDSEKKEINENKIKNDQSKFHPSGEAELLLSFDLYKPNKLSKIICKYPFIGAKVYSCSDEQMSKYVKEFGKQNDNDRDIYAKIGELTSNNAKCNISLNALFGRHCAIVGATGGGKSWTVAKLTEIISNQTSNKVILIDATGEYANLTDNSVSFGENVSFPYKYLSNTDFCFLFRECSPNTVSVLCEAIHTLKLIKLKKLSDGIKVGKDPIIIKQTIAENIHLFKDCNFDIKQLPAQLVNECVKVGRTTYEEDNFKLSYTSHLISRINLFLTNRTMCSALGIDDNKTDDIISKITNFIEKDKTNGILRISFEKISYDFSIREIAVNFVSFFLLEKSRTNIFKKSPLILFVDEAHQFLNKRINAEDDTVFSLQNIDSIAKECRKYGLFLCLATQMARDIPIGTLSQIGTFIVHRLINEQDKKAIENASSLANRSVLSFLPVLGKGEALLIGVDFPMPLLIRLDVPSTPPDSNTPKLSKKN